MAAKGEYPIPKFHFQVEWGNEFRIGFTEVSGLDFETEVIEYREGNSKKYNKSKQPGLTKFSNITLKRGTFEGDFDYYKEWRKTYYFQEGNKTGSMYRRTVTISRGHHYLEAPECMALQSAIDRSEGRCQ